MLFGGDLSNDHLPFVEAAQYLGFLMGPEVTVEEIFEGASRKALDRLHSYHAARDYLTVPERVIVANVFILSIFGYLGRLYLIPSTMATQIGTEVGRFVVPARFFSAKLLSRPTEELGLKPPPPQA